MASAPEWNYGLSQPAQFVAAYGLAGTASAPTTPLGDQAWDQLEAECARNGLSGLLIDAVAQRAFPASDAQRERVARLELDLTWRRIGYDQRVTPVLAEFDRGGIDVLVLKGRAVACCEYPDDQLRPTGDLDVLVRSDQIDAAVQVLEAIGGVRTDPEPAPGWTRLVGKGATVHFPDWSIEVDLHRILVWGPLGVRVPPDDLWGALRAFKLAGRTCNTMGREETLLHACAHLCILGVSRAREARDVAQIARNPDLDVDRLLDLADRWGQQAVLATAVVLSERELGLVSCTGRLSSWAAQFPLRHLDRLWLRGGAPVGRVRGIEQAGVFWELGRLANAGAARRTLVRANLRPAPGTYPPAWARVVALVRRVTPWHPRRIGRPR